MLLNLFVTFFKIGLFTFGGGYAMIPLIEKEIIEEKKWISREELLEIISISQMTPGPIAINAATFVGKKLSGFFGSIMATLGVVAPSLIIITFIAMFFSKDFDNPIIQKVFIGLRAGITAMILISVKKLFNTGIKDKVSLIIFIVTLLILLSPYGNPIGLILFFGIGSIIFYIIFKEKFIKFTRGDK